MRSMSHRIRRLAPGAALLLVLVAGCDGDAAPDDTAAPAEEGGSVTIAGSAFDPGSLTVRAGSDVVFTNSDSFPHTATADDGTFDEHLDADAEATVTLDEPGTYAYHCTIHPTMTGEIVVE